MDRNILRNNTIFWSRMGIGIGYKVLDEDGNPVIGNDTFSELRDHQMFYNHGVKIHSFILEAGWVGDGKYNFTTTDKTMDAACKIGEDVLLIPRIKLDPPYEWLKNHPEEVFVYYDGPRTPEEISAMVNTPLHDCLGYEAPDGMYMGNPKYNKPNVGGKISNQSFSSDKWLEDAKAMMKVLFAHLEEKYGDKILGYHIAYGTSGETLLWGRISRKFGDYGIGNQRKFKAFLKEKYGIEGELPPPDERYNKKATASEFMRENLPIARYYDEFMGEQNSHAVEFLCKAAKEFAPTKLTGVFYGYFMGIAETGYTGHTHIQKLLDSPYVDFFAAPKLYSRCAPGDSGGEHSITQSVNLCKVWVDECDVRTHLAAPDTPKIWASENMLQTRNALFRELSKNMSHDSGLWFMDLGGGWYNSDEMMDLVEELDGINTLIRQKPHQSESDVLVVADEMSTGIQGLGWSLSAFAADFICNIKRSGVLVDIFRTADITKLDLKKYKLIVFSYDMCLNKETVDYVKENTDATIMFQYMAGCMADGNFSFRNTEEVTGFSICDSTEKSEYSFPTVKIKNCVLRETSQGSFALRQEKGRTIIMNTIPKLSIDEIGGIVRDAGCHVYCDADYTLYGDNRFLCVIASDKEFSGMIDFGKEKQWRKHGSDESGISKTVPLDLKPFETALFIF